jgi:hypothetical protein
MKDPKTPFTPRHLLCDFEPEAAAPRGETPWDSEWEVKTEGSEETEEMRIPPYSEETLPDHNALGGSQ